MHCIHVDAGAGALHIFALQRMRDAAGEFNDVEAALNVAAGVSNHLAMFGRKRPRQFFDILLNQFLEAEHDARRSEEHTSELQSLMRTSYAVFCLKKKKQLTNITKEKKHTQNKYNS